MVDDFRIALETAGEIAMLAPTRWRERPQLERYLALVATLDSALQNTQVLITGPARPSEMVRRCRLHSTRRSISSLTPSR